MSYRVAEANTELCSVYDDDRLVGHVRKGMDGKWYPELPALHTRQAAIRRLMLFDTDRLDVTVPMNPTGKDAAKRWTTP